MEYPDGACTNCDNLATRIAELEAEVERKDVVIAGLKLAGLTNSALLSQLTEANGLLDEVQDLCKVQENFPFRGHLEDILAKRKGGA